MEAGYINVHILMYGIIFSLPHRNSIDIVIYMAIYVEHAVLSISGCTCFVRDFHFMDLLINKYLYNNIF